MRSFFYLYIYININLSIPPSYHMSPPPVFLVGSVLLIFVVCVCVVLLCVFTVSDPCCDVRYDFRIKTMFGSSLPPGVCRRAHILFILLMLFVFVCV